MEKGKTVFDPIECCAYDARLQCKKYCVDECVISEYYKRMSVGNLPLSAFYEMRNSTNIGELTGWMDDKCPRDTMKNQFTRKVFSKFGIQTGLSDRR